MNTDDCTCIYIHIPLYLSIFLQSHQAYVSPLSVLERLDTALGVEGNMKNGNEEVAQIVRYTTVLVSLKTVPVLCY